MTGASAFPNAVADGEINQTNRQGILPKYPNAPTLDIRSLWPKREPSIWKHEGQKRWMKWSRPLTDEQMLGVMSDEGRGLYRGCHWGEYTRFGVLDIDQGSQYHNYPSFIDLCYRFTRVGLTLTAYQSSESGGWHLYFFFEDEVQAMK